MSLPQKREDTTYTYGDYSGWPESEGRFELIEGKVYDMTPAPSPSHQRILLELSTQLHHFLQGKPCEVFLAPFDVRLPKSDEADDDVTTVVQPDITIICYPKKIDDKGCRGAPDLVVEILSPSTASKDHIKKRALYEKHGVKEYWLVHPTDRTVMVYRTDSAGKYNLILVLDDTNRLSTPLFPGLDVDLSQVFQTQINAVKEPAHSISPTPSKKRARAKSGVIRSPRKKTQ